MNLVLLTHPAYLGLVSQAHFAKSLAVGFRARGHSVEVVQPQPRLHRWTAPRASAKWAGYLDQYLLFPFELRARLREDPADTLYVVCDQALGPWVAQLTRRPHVVHCHDLLALRSALGEVPQNPTSFTGRLYQRYIRRGFRQARHFIAISENSRAELHRVGGVEPITSEVVYNGLNHPYRRRDRDTVQRVLGAAGLTADARGYLLHVGGGQWYKNTAGVIHLYASHAIRAVRNGKTPQALWMVSPPPGEAVRVAMAELPAQAEVRFFSGLGNQTLEALYSGASALLFPSHAEGFGWPILEALACGCPVITTAEAPMTEVGGEAASYVARLQIHDDVKDWANAAADVLDEVLRRSPAELEVWRASAQGWTKRFAAEAAIDGYLSIYQRVLALETKPTRLDWSAANET